MLSVSLLGDFCIKHDNQPISEIDTPRLQSMLAYLMLHRGAPQSRSHLAFLFWPDTNEAQARTNLRNLLHHLRRSLPAADTYLDVDTRTLQWRNDAAFTLDVADFEIAITSAERLKKQSDLTSVYAALEQAVNIYKGDLLPGCYEDWIIPIREGLRQSYLSALEQLVHILEDQRNYADAINLAQRILRHDPFHEATYRQLIRLHALKGDRAGALRVYHTCTTVLKRELDVEPSSATQEAYRQLLGAEPHVFKTAPITTAFSPIVGRESEWLQLLQAWNRVTGRGEPQVVMISGVAGIGKTRLVEEMLQWAVRQGIPIASTRCYAAEGALAFSPVTTWLRANPLVPLEDVWLAEVARLLPELFTLRPDLSRPVALTEPWQRQRLFEALSRAILGLGQPFLLTIDDLQWCDQDTLDWLHFLIRFDRSARFLVIGTYRTEEVDEDHPLASMLQALRIKGQVFEIDLQALDERATQTLVKTLAGKELSVETGQLLFQETEGNPLFVVETVRARLLAEDRQLQSVGEQKLTPEGRGNEERLPPKVQSVIVARLGQLSPPAREMAELAATIGREFSFKLLSKTSGCEEELLVRQLDELWRRRIVREHGTDAYDFSHDKLREVAYSTMSAARRRLLHRNIAQGLEILNNNELNPISHQVAVHYERAGVPEKAIPYYLRAAKVARQVYANDEAISLLQHAISLAENIHLGSEDINTGVIMQVWEELGDIYEMRAHHDEAKRAYYCAQTMVSSSDHIGRARLYRKIGFALREERLYKEALEACHQAEVSLGKVPEEDSQNWWREWIEVQVDRIWSHYWLDQWPEMEALVEKVQPVVQTRGSVGSRIHFLMASCLMHLRKEHYVISDELLANQREAFYLCQTLDDLRTKVDIQFELGFLLLWRHELDEAEVNLQAALEYSKIAEIMPRQTLLLTYLTVLNRFRGQIEGVMNYAKLAQKVAIASHMPDYVAAAKGNQAWLAWREGDLQTAKQIGQEALAIWEQSPLMYPFQWLALWPLLGEALVEGRVDEAWVYTQKLIEPTQQQLPNELNKALEVAVQSKMKDQADIACSRLDRAVMLAKEMGYL